MHKAAILIAMLGVGCSACRGTAQQDGSRGSVTGPTGSSPAARDDALFSLFEYTAGLRELALAEAVRSRTKDPAIRTLATIVRDGHQAGLAVMRGPARKLGLTLPAAPAANDKAMIAAALELPPARLDAYFLRRQRALHAWDVAAFADYARVASEPELKRYVMRTLAPLRAHAALVDRVARAHGVVD